MDLEKFRATAGKLPHVAQTVQWGSNLVFWVGDKTIGGKMFAVADLEPGSGHVCGFAAGPEGAAELLEREGIKPAPYLARAHWVAVERWNALCEAEWRQWLTASHALVLARLPRRVHAALQSAELQRSRPSRTSAKRARAAKPKTR